MTSLPFLLLLLAALCAATRATETNYSLHYYNYDPDWYIEDHPYKHVMLGERAANGSWVPFPNATIGPLTKEEFHGVVRSKLPWYIRWYATSHAYTIREAIGVSRKIFYYFFVSPMDYGQSKRSVRNRKDYEASMRMFWYEMVGRGVVHGFVNRAKEVLTTGLQNMVDEQLFTHNFQTMSVDESAVYLNISAEDAALIKKDVAEASKINYTQPFEAKTPADLSVAAMGASPEILKTVKYYQPYSEYTKRYYNAVEESELKPPSLPAAVVYPWPWHVRIAQTRAVLLQMMQVAAAAASNSSQGEVIHRRLHSVDGSGSGSSGNRTNDTATEQEAMRLITQQIGEFHFSTGLPRFNSSRTNVVFPTLATFVNESASVTDDIEPDAGDEDEDDNHATLAGNYTGRAGVYAATASFYSFTSVQPAFVQLEAQDEVVEEATAPPGIGRPVGIDPLMMAVPSPAPTPPLRYANCSARLPCLARSGVTVYTPSLAKAVHELFANLSLARMHPAAARTKRLNWLQHMTQQAFEAETRALHTGLMAPSTVWYSASDRDTDLVSDASMAMANATKIELLAAGEKKGLPRTLFTKLTSDSESPLVKLRSHYATTNTETRIAVEEKRSVARLEPLSNDELGELIQNLRKWTQDLQNTTRKYVATRDADPMHAAMVNATQEKVLYEGRMYSLLGYGYLLPSSNKGNVAYRDHKLPDPFHLALRLLVRVQESRLLLPDESRMIAACLAMLRFDIEYYKCGGDSGELLDTSASDSSDDDGDDVRPPIVLPTLPRLTPRVPIPMD